MLDFSLCLTYSRHELNIDSTVNLIASSPTLKKCVNQILAENFTKQGF